MSTPQTLTGQPGPELAEGQLAITDLLARLTHAVRRSRELDAAAQAEHDAAMIRGAVVPELRELVSTTVSLLDEIEEHYRATGVERAEDIEPDVNFDDMFADPGDDQQERRPESIPDICFVGRFELQQAAGRLSEDLEQLDRTELVARCARCRGSVVNVSSVLDRAIADAEGWMRVVDTVPELEESLVVRAAYAALRDELSAAPDPETSLREALVAARDALGQLTQPRVANVLRVADRDNVIRLLGRVGGWLDAETPDEKSGQRLWEEVTFVAEMLLQVNNRQELVAHDAATARKLKRRIDAAQGIGSLDRSFFSGLVQMRGRSGAVDSIVARLETIVREQLGSALGEIADELAEAAGSASALPPESADAAGGDSGGVDIAEMFEFDLESMGLDEDSSF